MISISNHAILTLEKVVRINQHTLKLITQLKKLGLSQQEAEVYVATLELGEGTVQEIARQAGIKRPTAYNIIENLRSRKLINVAIRGKKRKFIAAGTGELEAIIRERNEILQEIIPQIKVMGALEGDIKPKVRLFEGLEGAKTYLQGTLDAKQPIKAFVDFKVAYGFMGTYIDDYIKKRIKNKIPIQVIAPYESIGRGIQKKDKKELREVRLIPPKNFPIEIEMEIYGNHVGIISFSKKNLITVLIENKKIACSMRSIFDFAWEYAGLIEEKRKRS